MVCGSYMLEVFARWLYIFISDECISFPIGAKVMLCRSKYEKYLVQLSSVDLCLLSSGHQLWVCLYLSIDNAVLV